MGGVVVVVVGWGGRREGRFPSLSLSLLVSLSCRLSLSPLSVSNDNDHSSSRALSLCTHSPDLPQRARVHGPWPIPCRSEHVRIMQRNCASLVPLGTKWAALCWKCLMCHFVWSEVGLYLCFVFGCVSM